MCSARGCLITWTAVILVVATAALTIHCVKYKDEGFHDAYSIIVLVYISIVVGLNLTVLLGAIGKIKCLLCLANFFIGIVLFSSIATAITWVVVKLINGRDELKKWDTKDIVIFIGLMCALFVILMIIPCIQFCALAKTRKKLENERGGD